MTRCCCPLPTQPVIVRRISAGSASSTGMSNSTEHGRRLRPGPARLGDLRPPAGGGAALGGGVRRPRLLVPRAGRTGARAVVGAGHAAAPAAPAAAGAGPRPQLLPAVAPALPRRGD